MALETFGRLYGDVNPDMHNVNYQLTTWGMREFNGYVLDDDRVYYQSVYTTMQSPLDDWIYFHTFNYMIKTAGPNDGIVSAFSAQWGDNIIEIEGRISHTNIVDMRKIEIFGIDIPDIYINIVNELGKKGF
jgi:triacylglycerol esterase/lipase EstA (alpha/beta hydrolase family)